MALGAYSALLLAVRNRVRALGWEDKDCEVMASGEPPPTCGLFFAAVHRGDRTAKGKADLHEVYALSVTVTARVNCAPHQAGVRVLYADGMLDAKCDAIIQTVHKDGWNHQIANAANTLLSAVTSGSPPHGFCLGLRFLGDGPPQPKGPDWFSAAPESGVVGYAQELRFGFIERIQSQENLT